MLVWFSLPEHNKISRVSYIHLPVNVMIYAIISSHKKKQKIPEVAQQFSSFSGYCTYFSYLLQTFKKTYLRKNERKGKRPGKVHLNSQTNVWNKRPSHQASVDDHVNCLHTCVRYHSSLYEHEKEPVLKHVLTGFKYLLKSVVRLHITRTSVFQQYSSTFPQVL